MISLITHDFPYEPLLMSLINHDSPSSFMAAPDLSMSRCTMVGTAISEGEATAEPLARPGRVKLPKMELLYHISGHILGGHSLKFRPKK